MIPARGVELLSFELLQAGKGGGEGLVQLPGRDDDGVGCEGFATGRSERPLLRRVVPVGALDVHAEAHQAIDAELGGDRVDVVEDLPLWRAYAHPVPSLCVGVGVELARDVAGRAGVGVVQPGAAGRMRGIQDADVAEPVALKLDRGGDAAEAGADDDHGT